LQGWGLLQVGNGAEITGQFQVGECQVDGAVTGLAQVHRFGMFAPFLPGQQMMFATKPTSRPQSRHTGCSALSCSMLLNIKFVLRKMLPWSFSARQRITIILSVPLPVPARKAGPMLKFTEYVIA
jgi:hypothetical protein